MKRSPPVNPVTNVMCRNYLTVHIEPLDAKAYSSYGRKLIVTDSGTLRRHIYGIRHGAEGALQGPDRTAPPVPPSMTISSSIERGPQRRAMV